MSRIAQRTMKIPAGVTVAVSGNAVTVNGKAGTLTYQTLPSVVVSVEGAEARVVPANYTGTDEQKKELWNRTAADLGLTWRLINNMIVGVSVGYKKVLQIEGVGYRAQLEGQTLVLQLGFSHDVRIVVPNGITVTVDAGGRDKSPLITIEGANKELVGRLADFIKRKRPVEPYKGKGVRYQGETVRKKEGKAASK